MSLESANFQPVPQPRDDQVDAAGVKPAAVENQPLPSVLSADKTTGSQNEKILKDLGNLLSSASKTSDIVLPAVQFDGLELASGPSKQRTQYSSDVHPSKTQEARSSQQGDRQQDTSKGRDNFDDKNDDEPEAVKKFLKRYEKAPPNSPDRSPDKPDSPDNPDKPDKPDKPDRPDKPVNPDKPEAKVKPRYEMNEIEQAIKTATDKNLPLVVHLGFKGCPPCGKMEAESWPAMEKDKDVNDKAVYLHLDIKAAEKMGGRVAELVKQLEQGAQAFPTIRVFNVTDQGNGKPGLQMQDSKTQFLSYNELKEFIKPYLK